MRPPARSNPQQGQPRMTAGLDKKVLPQDTAGNRCNASAQGSSQSRRHLSREDHRGETQLQETGATPRGDPEPPMPYALNRGSCPERSGAEQWWSLTKFRRLVQPIRYYLEARSVGRCQTKTSRSPGLTPGVARPLELGRHVKQRQGYLVGNGHCGVTPARVHRNQIAESRLPRKGSTTAGRTSSAIQFDCKPGSTGEAQSPTGTQTARLAGPGSRGHRGLSKPLPREVGSGTGTKAQPTPVRNGSGRGQPTALRH